MNRSEIVSATVDALVATGRHDLPVVLIPYVVDLVERAVADLAPRTSADDELSHLVNTLAGVENERDVARCQRDALDVQVAELTRERDDLARQVAELTAKGDAPKRRGRPPKSEQVDQAPAEVATHAEPAADQAPACFTPDRESIRAELVALGRDVGLPILARFGASRFAELPDADLPAVAAMIVAHKKGEAA